jgi:hypothetical protein
VVGAGIGGLTAAKALSSYFGYVTVLERDALPAAPVRTGTPQRGKFMFSSEVVSMRLSIFFRGSKQKSSAQVPFRCGSALNLWSKCRASIRFHSATLASIIYA